MSAARLLPAALLLAFALPAGRAPAQPSGAAETAPTRPAARAPSPAAQPFGGRPGQPRMPKTLSEPLGLGPPSATPLRPEPAPVPNRDIEPPRDRLANSLAPSLEPMVLQPDRRQGMTFGREHLRETGPDRPFDNILPGARLRIPFEGSTGR